MSEIVNSLLEHGHDYDAVYNQYSLEEIRIYYARIVESEIKQARENAVIMFNATRGDPKGFKRMINDMERSAKKRRRPKTQKEVGASLFAGLSNLMSLANRKG